MQCIKACLSQFNENFTHSTILHYVNSTVIACAIFGLSLPVFLPVLIDLQLVLVISSVLVLLVAHYIFRLMLIFLLGFVISHISLERVIDAQLPHHLDGESFLLELRVVSLPEQKFGGWQFDAQVLKADTIYRKCDAFCRRVIGHSIAANWDDLSSSSSGVEKNLKPNQRYRVVAKLKRPHALMNPGGGDGQARLLAKSIVARASIQSREGEQLCESHQFIPSIHQRRFNIRQLIREQKLEHAALIEALAIGVTSSLRDDQWQTLRATGTNHLMAISGLHIGLAAALGFYVGRLLITLVGLFFPLQNPHRVSIALSIALSLGYAALAGFSIPTQRALVLVVVMQLCLFAGKKMRPWLSLGIAACAVILISPFAVLDKGFYLSFSAVAALIWFLKARQNGRISWWKSLGKAQFAVALGLAPILWSLQLSASMVGPLVNAGAVPWVSILVVPVILVGIVCNFLSETFAQGCFYFANFLLDMLWWFLRYAQSVNEHISAARLPLHVWPWVYAAWSLLIFPWRTRLPLFGLATFLVVFFSEWKVQPSITILDVGQGLSIVVQGETDALVYDVGARYKTGFDVGRAVVTPFLERQGHTDIEGVVLSHGDNDHAGGFQALSQSFQVGRVLTNAPIHLPKQPSENEQIPLQIDGCFSGASWMLEPWEISVLWPIQDNFIEDNNHSSCVLLIEYDGFRGLFTGDIDQAAEELLLASGRLPSDVDVLIAPHHGSATSSSYAFLNHVRPKHVIFSVGYGNAYGHPKADVLARYADLGSEIWRTDLDGAITFSFDLVEKGIATGAAEVKAERRQRWRPWLR